MKTRTPEAAPLGDLIAAAFDEAARYRTDPDEVARLAAQTVRYLLRRAQRIPVTWPAPCPAPAPGASRTMMPWVPWHLEATRSMS
jgi:hypothetical protein